VRVPDFVPAPQLVEQVPYVQPDQTPSTGQLWVLQLCDEVAEPAQSAPPWARPSHVRVIDWVPVPQLLEQVPYAQLDQTPSTGHSWVLQLRDEVAEEPSAVHSAPFTYALWNGAGLVHVRVIDCVPVPQLLEQVPYVQSDQPPSTWLRPASVQSPVTE